MAVLNLIEREQRLLAFLRECFPGFRPVASLQSRAEAMRRGHTETPEVRVSPALEGSTGLLRWRVEITGADSGPEAARRAGPVGYLAAADRLREGLAVGDRPWRLSTAGASATARGGDSLVEHLEEAFTPAGRVPQRLCVFAVPCGSVVSATIPAGIREFDLLDLPEDPPAAGTPVFGYRDIRDSEFLGEALEIGALLRTTLPTLRSRQDGMTVMAMAEGIAASEAAEEDEVVESSRFSREDIALAGHRRRKLLGASTSTLTLRFRAMTQHEVQAWEVFLDAWRGRPELLLVRADRSLAQVSPSRVKTQRRADGQAGELEIEFSARPLASLAPFAEVPP